MRLINCRIENFGKLQDFTYYFDEKLNVLCENNGWGKSTFAAFIRVMFFGIMNDGKRKGYVNDRQLYKPWQGGVFGGELTFEANEKKYVITRTFGEKANQDTFELREADTNLVSRDFSENIGEELFQIDAESFKRTAFISQSDIQIEMNAKISAKMGNLSESTDDITKFDSVNEKLQKWLNSQSPKLKKGSLYAMKNRLTELSEKVKRGRDIDNSIEEISRLREEKSTERTELKKELSDLQGEQKILSSIKDAQAVKARYEAVIQEVSKRERTFEECRAQFPGDVPRQQDLDTYMDLCADINAKKKEMEICRMTFEEKEKLKAYGVRFDNGAPTEREINDMMQKWNLRQDRKSFLETGKMNLDMFEKINEGKKMVKPAGENRFLSVLIIGLVMLVLGAAIIPFVQAVGIVGLIAGVLLIVFYVIKKQGADRNNDVQEEQVEDDKMSELKMKISEAEQVKAEIESDIRAFVEKYGLEYNELSVTTSLSDLRMMISDYAVLRNKSEKFIMAEKEYVGMDGKIKEYIRSLNFDADGNLYNQMKKIKEMFVSYTDALRELKNANESKLSFEQSNGNMEEVINTEVPENLKSMEQIGDRIKEITEKLENVADIINEYDRQLEEKNSDRLAVTEAEEQLDALREQYEEGMKKYEMVHKTRELLNRSKELFTAKYTEPINTAFQKYYGMMDKNRTKEYMFDANVNVTSKELGKQRDTNFLSRGYQDITSLCYRLALLDAMYQEEKPVIILDDPFANLDDEKTDGGFEFLNQVSRKYQVIYFTCHKSATPIADKSACQ